MPQFGSGILAQAAIWIGSVHVEVPEDDSVELVIRESVIPDCFLGHELGFAIGINGDRFRLFGDRKLLFGDISVRGARATVHQLR